MEQAILETAPPQPAPQPPVVTATDEAAELTVTRKDLLEELVQLQDVAARKTSIPILCNILMQTNGQVLLLTATDCEIGLRTSCPARVKKQGAFTIPARKLYDYIRLLPEGDINIKVLANEWVQLRSGRSHTKMVGLAGKNFPVLPLFPRDSAVMLQADILRILISRTIIAISKEESRYTLNGALLILRPEGAAMVSTDGHRLALLEYPHLKIQVTQEWRVLLPHKALSEVSSLLASIPVEHIQFARDDATLFFVVGKRLLTSRQLSGRFPQYEAVLPRDHKAKVILQRSELEAAIRRVSQFSDERSNAVKIRVEGDQMQISSSAVEAGESEDTLPVTHAGAPIITGFNSGYLLDFLRVVGVDSLEFHFKDAHSASELRPIHAADIAHSYRYVVMPMRV